MREYVLATETNCDMPQDFIDKHGILVIPHYYTVEEKQYGIGFEELSIKGFYDEMRAGKKVGTMASNPAVIYEKFSEVVKSGKDILFISFSSELSGGYSNICMGARQVMEENPGSMIQVVDTLSASVCEGMLLQYAAELRKEGKEIAEAADILRQMAPHLCIYFTVDDLDYLFRGGRLSKGSAVIGNMINLKPILSVNDEGKLVPVAKVRGSKKAINTILDSMEEKMGSYKEKQVFVGVIHGDCEDAAKELAAKITEKFGITNIMVLPIGPSIGAHSGPGTLGVGFLGENR